MNEQPERKSYIGGSDVAAILGLSPWRTPLDVWLAKTGQAEAAPADPDRERLFRRGKLMEPVVVDMLVAEHGLEITRRSTPGRPNRHVDAEHAFLGAEVDFEWEVTPAVAAAFPARIPEGLVGTEQNGEVKTVHPWGAGQYGEEGTDEIPVHYAAQAMHGLMVTGRELTVFPVLVGSDNLLVYWVRRDEETIAGMRERLVRFWREHVLAGVAPPPVNLPDVYKLFKRRAPSRIEATPEVAAMISTLRALRVRAATTEEGVEAVEYELGVFLLGAAAIEKPGAKDRGRHVVTVGGRPELTVAFQEQNRIDAEALREKHPAVAAEVAKISQFYTFTLRRNKP